MDTFSEIKEEILKRARTAKACRAQYLRAYEAETLPALMNVIKDNFDWCVRTRTIDTGLIMRYRDEFADNDIFVNTFTNRGFLLASGSATAEASSFTTVVACDNATVMAYCIAKVVAFDNATVEARGIATVEAHDNATVRAQDNVAVTAYGNATVEAYAYATIRAYDNVTVEAHDYAYCSSFVKIDCKLSDHAIYRLISKNTVYHADSSMKFVNTANPTEPA